MSKNQDNLIRKKQVIVQTHLRKPRTHYLNESYEMCASRSAFKCRRAYLLIIHLPNYQFELNFDA